MQDEELIERQAVVAWLRHQSDLGANRGNDAAKGSTKRAAFGGGSLALSRVADMIEAGEHRTNDNAALAASPSPVVGNEGRREQIARIIDPRAWAMVQADREHYPADPQERWLNHPLLKDALAKADAILSLSTPVVGGEREAS